MARTVLIDKNGNGISWLQATIKSCEILGHPAKPEEMLEVMLEYVIETIPDSAKTPTQTIYNNIYRHSPDSKSWNGSDDIFSKTEDNLWGLTSWEQDNDTLNFIEESFPEGKLVEETHYRRERNKRLVETAKKRFSEKNNGELFCEACGFNFRITYGEVGKDFIEAHHIKPVSEMKEGEVTRIEDIVMVCANCHRILHRYRPWIYERGNLKKILMY